MPYEVTRWAYDALALAAEAAGFAIARSSRSPVDGNDFDQCWAEIRGQRAGNTVVLDLAEALPIGAVAPIDLAMTTSRDVGSALAVAATGWWILASPGETASVQQRLGTITFALRYASRRLADPITDAFVLAAIVRRLRVHARRGVRVARVTLGLEPTAGERERLRKYFGDVVSFGAPVSTLTLDPVTAGVPLCSADPVVHRVARERLLAPPDHLLFEVRIAVRAHLAASPSLASVARHLGRSARALQRTLTAAGTSFRRLCDDVRRDAAIELLELGSDRIQAIATHVGFADQASFTRAFTRWTGVGPRMYRRECQMTAGG